MSFEINFLTLKSDFTALQIIDEKSLIKKYQNQIRSLKEELDQLKRGIVTDSVPQLKDIAGEDIVLLKQKVNFLYIECSFCLFSIMSQSRMPPGPITFED